MEYTSNTEPLLGRDIYYFRQRYKNRTFSTLLSFFELEAARTGVKKKDIADRLKKDPSIINRWFKNPSNLTLETISDLLLALNAEPEPSQIVRFSDRLAQNYAHPIVAFALGLEQAQGDKAPAELTQVEGNSSVDFTFQTSDGTVMFVETKGTGVSSVNFTVKMK